MAFARLQSVLLFTSLIRDEVTMKASVSAGSRFFITKYVKRRSFGLELWNSLVTPKNRSVILSPENRCPWNSMYRIFVISRQHLSVSIGVAWKARASSRRVDLSPCQGFTKSRLSSYFKLSRI